MKSLVHTLFNFIILEYFTYKYSSTVCGIDWYPEFSTEINIWKVEKYFFFDSTGSKVSRSKIFAVFYKKKRKKGMAGLENLLLYIDFLYLHTRYLSLG